MDTMHTRCQQTSMPTNGDIPELPIDLPDMIELSPEFDPEALLACSTLTDISSLTVRVPVFISFCFHIYYNS